jgi:YidC/Oxa1 family membrane protein insertase
VFTTLIVQPIFNLLVLIYNVIPGHNFGLSIILFTIVVRLLLWPFVKRQLHQTKLMRRLQPELKEIKKKAKGDKRQESVMMMELYKERGVSMFASLRMLLIQLPILFGLYAGLTRLLKDPHQIVTFSYPWIQHFDWMQQLARNIGQFDETLFGLIDLTKPALGSGGPYWPAMVLVVCSAIVQFYQSKQLLPQDKDSRSLRSILRDAGDGKQADQSEVNAAVSRNTIFLFPALIFLFSVSIASAISLYWLVSGIIAYVQQSIVLRDDVGEMENIADKKSRAVAVSEREKVAIEAEIVNNTTPKQKAAKKVGKAAKSKKRRK